MQHGELCTDRCPRIIGRFFQLECKYVFNIVTAGHIWWYAAVQQQHEVTVQASIPASGNRSRDPTTTKNTQNKDIVPASGNRFRDLPEWLEEFTEHLEDEGVLASRDTPANT